MSHKSAESNPKVRATTAIWGCAVGMLGICIPLVAITNSGIILPLLVIIGAAGGTFAVWFAPDKHQQGEIQLAQTVKSLKERVMDLEAICTSLPEVENPLSLSKTDSR